VKEIIHALEVHAPPSEVFRALTTEHGLSGWWTTGVRVDGDLVRFTFEDPFHPVMRVTERDEPRAVEWTLESGHEPWNGSTFRFDLQERDATTAVLFRMSYGQELPDEQYGVYNYNWAYYLESLRLLCQEGSGKPFQPTGS
jgi:uncharacterized protein YndB with AHSA1/START domain